ncbi:MAG: N-acetylmuramoyl-L-alanine amidase, partial [Candidatus Eiseniibacteriota bacterium]
MRLRLAAAAALAAAVALLHGCAHAPPPTTRPHAGYDHRVDELASVDASGLAGKRIALDPGHGGVFRGAIGVHGLSEAEVNLGVALELRT